MRMLTLLGFLLWTGCAARVLPHQSPDLAPPRAARTTDSGLMYQRLIPGDGTEHPNELATVTVHYTGWTTDGNMFDSSIQRGRPETFSLDRLIDGWSEGVQLMVAGETMRFWIPSELAYDGRPGAPQGMLVFDVNLISFVNRALPPAPPSDVAGPPSDATVTASGLSYRVLSPGTGTEHPTTTSKVTVHYTGWTTDGDMFDSSIQRGRPETFALDRVIDGWSEGVQLMVAGEKTRFWIPSELAYDGAPGRPQGMLVFDVELLEIDGQ